MTLKGGPAAGTYMARRAPHWLRAVVSDGGAKDVLDQLDDTPTEGERVYVYERIGEAGHVHINTGRKKGTGFYALATYEYLSDVDGETLRETREWQAWCAIETNSARGTS